METTFTNIEDFRSMYNDLSKQDSGYFETQDYVIAETEKAICFDVYRGYLDKEKSCWIPKSQCQILIYENELEGISKRYFVKLWLYNNFK